MLKTYTPRNNAVFSLHSDRVKDFLKMREEWTGDSDVYPWCHSTHRPDVSLPSPIRFTWYSDSERQDYAFRVHLSRYPDFSDETVSDVIGLTEYDVYNLLPGCRYFWYVESIGKSYEKSNTSIFLTEDSYPRMIFISDNVTNVRDFGGAETFDGRRVKYGLLFRGSEIDGKRLPDSDGVRRLTNELKIKSDIDLRGDDLKDGITFSRPEELSQMTGTLFSLLEYDGAVSSDCQNRICADIFRLMSDDSIYPAYLHCAAGIDRTGTLLYILGLILGIKPGYLALDYEFSSLSTMPWADRKTTWLTEKVGSAILSAGDSGDDIYTAAEKYFDRVYGIPEAVEKLRRIFLYEPGHTEII